MKCRMRPGDKHTWRLRIGDHLAIMSYQGCAVLYICVVQHRRHTPDVPLTPATMVLICLRATFEIPTTPEIVDDGQPFLLVQWAHSTGGAPPEMSGEIITKKRIPPLSVGQKRSRYSSQVATACGLQSGRTELNAGVTESVFAFLCPRDAFSSESLCTVTWLRSFTPENTDGLRYNVVAQAVTDLQMPTTMLTNAGASVIAEPDEPPPPPPPEDEYYYYDGSDYYARWMQQPPVPAFNYGSGNGGKQLAVIVGVSKYSRKRGSDLEWCDEKRAPVCRQASHRYPPPTPPLGTTG